ncbi:MAG: hypothetical protein JNG90_05770, partial [Planctomycetaceae bacterium]|nr:hypothetical protein [Planctomycetaceae bacterium]
VVMLAVAMLGAATLFPRLHWRQAFGFALGLAPSLAIWMLYNWICFDHPLTTGFVHHALPLYGEAYQSGFLGIQPLDPLAVPGMLFSPARGMCFLSPFLVLAPVGWWRQFRGGEFRWDAIHAALLAGSLFLFAMTTIDWRGGWGTGTRYLVPMVPFLLVGVAGALRGVRAGEPVSILFGGLAAVGVILVAAASITVPLFPQEFDNPWVSLVGRLLGQGYLAPHLGTGAAGAWGGLVPYFLGALVTLVLVTTSGPARNLGVTAAAATLSLSLALIIIGWQATIPEPPGRQLVRDITRAECLMRLGFFEQAAREMLALQETPRPPSSDAAPGGSTRSEP